MHRRSGSGHSAHPPHHRQHTRPRRLLTILVEPHAPSTSPWSLSLVLRPISLPNRKSTASPSSRPSTPFDELNSFLPATRSRPLFETYNTHQNVHYIFISFFTIFRIPFKHETILEICDSLQEYSPLPYTSYLNWLVHIAKRKWLTWFESCAEAKRTGTPGFGTLGRHKGQTLQFGIRFPAHSFHTRRIPSSRSCWVLGLTVRSLVRPVCEDESIFGDCAVRFDGACLS